MIDDDHKQMVINTNAIRRLMKDIDVYKQETLITEETWKTIVHCRQNLEKFVVKLDMYLDNPKLLETPDGKKALEIKEASSKYIFSI